MILSADNYLFLYAANPDSPEVGKPLWNWAAKTTTGFRHIIDARLAFTLRHHGVTHFATANAKHFESLGLEKAWNPAAKETNELPA